MKCCSGSKCELAFLQLAQVLRNSLEKFSEGEVKDNLVYPGKLKTYSKNVSLLSGCYRQDLKGCNASMTELQNSPAIQPVVSNWSY